MRIVSILTLVIIMGCSKEVTRQKEAIICAVSFSTRATDLSQIQQNLDSLAVRWPRRITTKQFEAITFFMNERHKLNAILSLVDTSRCSYRNIELDTIKPVSLGSAQGNTKGSPRMDNAIQIAAIIRTELAKLMNSEIDIQRKKVKNELDLRREEFLRNCRADSVNRVSEWNREKTEQEFRVNQAASRVFAVFPRPYRKHLKTH